MITERAHIGSTRWARVGGILVLAFLGLPLFIGLGQEDLRNDEAIYSYSIDRVLETGDWLTPRAIPFDGPFLEKPPLKIWIVAGLVRAGIVPHDEWGLRSADALFGALAFLYVYAIGRLLAGPICGVVAVLVLFTFDPLLLVHGVRSNNMESALLLAYAGGLYHFARWDQLGQSRWRTTHALAVGAYFALGFMMKFVAVLFLPLICALALLWRSGTARPRVGDLWRAWIAPALLVLALCAPWFIAAYLHHGRMLWNVMLGQHVVTRFTGALDAAHLAPWSAYIEWIWGELVRAGTAWIVAVGLALLLVRAWTGTTMLARLVLLWLVVPITMISMGTSKLPHYAFPFLPPLAIGAGYAVATLVAVITGPLGALDLRWMRSSSIATGGHFSRAFAIVRGALVVGAAIALAVALWTALDGRMMWNLGGGHRFSNASIARPLVLGAFLLWLGTSPLATLHMWVIVPLMVLSIAPTYERVVDRLRRPDHPLSTLRDCALAIQRTSPEAGRSVYNAAHATASHPYFYYLRSLGPWTWADAPADDEVRRRLLGRAQQSPMIVSSEDLGAVMLAVARPEQRTSELARVALDQPIDSHQTTVSGVTDRDGLVIVVLPGPYQACVSPVVAAGWHAVGDGTTTRDDR